MDDKDLLLAIGQAVHKEMHPIKEHISIINQRIEHIENSITTMKLSIEEANKKITRLQVFQENEIRNGISLLLEGYSDVNKKLRRVDSIASDIDVIKDSISALNSVAKSNIEDISNLKRA